MLKPPAVAVAVAVAVAEQNPGSTRHIKGLPKICGLNF
jgi:hypothetical protein